MKKERIPFADAGRKLRLSAKRLRESEFVLVSGEGENERRAALATSGTAWRLWAACVELTASYSRSAETTYVRSLAKLVGVREDKVSPILRAFHEEGIFGWKKIPGSRGEGFLTLPSLAEPGESTAPDAPASTSKRKAAPPRCPEHPEVELWFDQHHHEDSAYVAKIVNQDGSAWCCTECTGLAWESAAAARPR